MPTQSWGVVFVALKLQEVVCNVDGYLLTVSVLVVRTSLPFAPEEALFAGSEFRTESPKHRHDSESTCRPSCS